MSVKWTLTRQHIRPNRFGDSPGRQKAPAVSYSAGVMVVYFLGILVNGFKAGLFGLFIPLIRRGAMLTAISIFTLAGVIFVVVVVVVVAGFGLLFLRLFFDRAAIFRRVPVGVFGGLFFPGC